METSQVLVGFCSWVVHLRNDSVDSIKLHWTKEAGFTTGAVHDWIQPFRDEVK